jgi:hypothetical protein
MLWDKYHFINSFAEYQGEHNQFFLIRRSTGSNDDKRFRDFDGKQQRDVIREYISLKVVYNPDKTTALIN